MNNPHLLQPSAPAGSSSDSAQAPVNPLARIVFKDVDPKSASFNRYGRRLETREIKHGSRTPYLRYTG